MKSLIIPYAFADLARAADTWQAKVAAALIAARALIADPKHWTRKTGARDRNGAAVPPCLPEACSFCAIGALDRVCTGQPLLYRDAMRWYAL